MSVRRSVFAFGAGFSHFLGLGLILIGCFYWLTLYARGKSVDHFYHIGGSKFVELFTYKSGASIEYGVFQSLIGEHKPRAAFTTRFDWPLFVTVRNHKQGTMPDGSYRREYTLVKVSWVTFVFVGILLTLLGLFVVPGSRSVRRRYTGGYERIERWFSRAGHPDERQGFEIVQQDHSGGKNKQDRCT